MNYHVMLVDAKAGDILTYNVLSDIHKHHINHAREELKKSVKYIQEKKSEHKYVVDLGDAFDLIVMGDKRYNFNEQQKQSNPLECVNNAKDEYLEDVNPIKEYYQDMIVGNHEQKYIQRTGYNITLDTAKHLYLPKERISSSMCIVLLKVYIGGHRRYTYSIMLSHGNGSGVKDVAGAMRKTQDHFSAYNIDYGFMGHIHIFSHSQVMSKSYISDGDSNVRERKTYKNLVSCSCFLKKSQLDTECYAEDKTYVESTIGHQWLEIGLEKNKEDCVAEIRKVIY